MSKINDTNLKEIKNRLRRIEGQARGIVNMIDNKEECEKIIHQLSALSSAVQNTNKLILSKYIVCCIEQEMDKSDGNWKEEVENIMSLFVKSRL